MLEVYNNQGVIDLGEDLLERLEVAGQRAYPLAMRNPANGGGVLGDLDLVEVSLVDDETSADVHWRFMAVPGATDVITFAHGEIVIGVEVAQRQAEEYGVSFEEELVRYVVHGLLHLAGHEDEVESERVEMTRVQEEIVGGISKF